ncbi:MAG: hypothetical protein AB8G11_11540 [Saprospiraceae bacterium]
MNTLLFMAVLSIQTVTLPSTSIQNNIVENNNPESETAVSSEFLQGNWRIVEINRNGYKAYSRDSYHFFNDKTGYQGRNKKIEWEMTNGYLFLTTYEGGNINKTKWKVRKDYKNYLILTRFETKNNNGMTVTKIIKIKLIKK